MKNNTATISPFKFAVILIVSIILAFIAGAGIWFMSFMKRAEDPIPVHTDPPFIDDYIIGTEPEVGPGATPGTGGSAGGNENNGDVPSGPSIDAGSSGSSNTNKNFEWGKDIVNILLMGYDKSELREDTYSIFRTDTLILVTVNKIQKKIYLTSVPRDSYVWISTNYNDPQKDTWTKKDKINSVTMYASYQNADPHKAVCDTVAKLFNAPVNYYVSVDMDLFEDIVDRLGGVECNVEVDVKYNGKLVIPKGVQKLDGKNALLYVRYRGTANADIGRVARQRNFLVAVFNQLKSWNGLTSLPGIFKDMEGKFQSNLTYEILVHLVDYAASDINSSDIVTKTMPGFFLDKNGISYWGIKQYERVHWIYDLFGISVKQDVQD